jgi:hypothetical protein
MPSPRHASTLPILWLAALAACSSSEEDKTSAPAPGHDAAVEASDDAGLDANGQDAGDDDAATDATAPDATAPDDATVPDDASAEATVPTTQEQEPNNGTTVDEYNDLPIGTLVSGAIGEVGDADLFRVPTDPGKVYLATLVAVGAQLQGNVTVIDTGRGGYPAGDDYVKLANAASDTASLAWLAMGDGGHFVIVRDQRNLSEATVGSADFTYELLVQEREASEFEGDALDFTLPVTDALQSCGDLRLHPFDGTIGTDVLVQFDTSGDMDGRLTIFAKSIGSWIARNDDELVGYPDPGLDVPLTESGPMWLVVENVDHEATQFDYAITATKP